MTIRRVGPHFNTLHRLSADQAAKLAAFVRRRGPTNAARALGVSIIVVENLASGGGASLERRDKVATGLSTLEACA